VAVSYSVSALSRANADQRQQQLQPILTGALTASKRYGDPAAAARVRSAGPLFFCKISTFAEKAQVVFSKTKASRPCSSVRVPVPLGCSGSLPRRAFCHGFCVCFPVAFWSLGVPVRFRFWFGCVAASCASGLSVIFLPGLCRLASRLAGLVGSQPRPSGRGFWLFRPNPSPLLPTR